MHYEVIMLAYLIVIFAVAARLQRQFEQLQLATTDRRRGSARTSGSDATCSVATLPINTSDEQRSVPRSG